MYQFPLISLVPHLINTEIGVTLDIQRKKHILVYNLLLLKFSKIILIYSFEAIYQHYK